MAQPLARAGLEDLCTRHHEPQRHPVLHLEAVPPLPILAVRPRFMEALARGPVVLSSPTGSGKSTEVPRWCAGRVLVVEPRRIACRSLAARVAEQEGCALGEAVGYVVRDERVLGAGTRIVFATPGMALRDRALLERADTVVLDEFHERSMELDLLLALLVRARRRALVVMSATLAGASIAAHVGGEHVEAEGSAFPVAVRHLGDPPLLPSGEALASRVAQALAEAARDPGDVLVFLPGKAEIERCQEALRGAPLSVLPLHGGLALDEQRRVFAAAPRRKVILATNVAETSLTIPGIGVVIDSGLVRQVRYQAGRGSLALVPIARDSATQRAGRAGRTAQGVCYRLWSASALLEPETLPELHRESLAPLLLSAAAWGAAPEELPFLDPPKPHALADARRDLGAWGALTSEGKLTADGEGLFSLPVAPLQARLLQSAEQHGCLADMLDLVAALSVGRPLFSALSSEPTDTELSGCDLTRTVGAMRGHDAEHVVGEVLREAHSQRARLAARLGVAAQESTRGVDRAALIAAAIAADPRVVHVARPRGRELALSNGGTELSIARDSALSRFSKLEAAVVLDTRAFGAGRDARVLVTCGAPIPLAAIARAGLGEERISAVQREHGRVQCTLERLFASRVVAERVAEPRGALLREALLILLERGSLFRDAVSESRERLARSALAAALAARATPGRPKAPPLELGAFLRARLDGLGVEEPDDVALLSAADFLAPDLPAYERAQLDADYPLVVQLGDATYRADYDLDKYEVTLVLVRGTRKDPPPLAYLPRFPGLRISASGPRGTSVVRPR